MPAPTARAIRLHASDNVIVALADLPAGEHLADHALTTADAIPRGHKIATAAIAPGDKVIRYGQIIGAATAPIAPGAHIHTHNLGMGDHAQDYAFASERVPCNSPLRPAAPSWATTAPTDRSARATTSAS